MGFFFYLHPAFFRTLTRGKDEMLAWLRHVRSARTNRLYPSLAPDTSYQARRQACPTRIMAWMCGGESGTPEGFPSVIGTAAAAHRGPRSG